MHAVATTDDTDAGPRHKARAERMCASTRQVRPVDELIRFVVAPDGAVVADLKRTLPGRGLWLSASREIIADAAKRGVFAKGFKRDVKADPALAEETERLLVKSLIDALAMAGKAGVVLSGFSKVEAALERGEAVALIHASDAAPDGVRKLNAVVRRESVSHSGDLPVLTELASTQLDLALGRSNVIHAALLAGPAGNTFLKRYESLARFRTPEGAAAQLGMNGRVRNLNG
jgi:predicted RNA-binding protein YlxR (DUF448 family)